VTRLPHTDSRTADTKSTVLAHGMAHQLIERRRLGGAIAYHNLVLIERLLACKLNVLF